MTHEKTRRHTQTKGTSERTPAVPCCCLSWELGATKTRRRCVRRVRRRVGCWQTPPGPWRRASPTTAAALQTPFQSDTTHTYTHIHTHTHTTEKEEGSETVPPNPHRVSLQRAVEMQSVETVSNTLSSVQCFAHTLTPPHTTLPKGGAMAERQTPTHKHTVLCALHTQRLPAL